MSKQLKALGRLLHEEHSKRLQLEAALRDAASIFRHELLQRQGLRYDAWCVYGDEGSGGAGGGTTRVLYCVTHTATSCTVGPFSHSRSPQRISKHPSRTLVCSDCEACACIRAKSPQCAQRPPACCHAHNASGPCACCVSGPSTCCCAHNASGHRVGQGHSVEHWEEAALEACCCD